MSYNTRRENEHYLKHFQVSVRGSHPMREISTLRLPTIDRDLLIEQHRSYAEKLAAEIYHSLEGGVDLSELVAYSNVGLIEAAGRYDPRRGVTFPTFAYYRIKGAIYDGLREMGYRSRAEYARWRFAAGSNDLLQTTVDDELSDVPGSAQSIDDEIEEVQSTIDALIPIFLLSLDTTRERLLPAAPGPGIATKFEQNELGEKLCVIVAELPEEYRRVVEGVYFNDQSMIEVAAQLGVSRSWISRLHTRAIKRLRESMQQHGLLDSS